MVLLISIIISFVHISSSSPLLILRRPMLTTNKWLRRYDSQMPAEFISSLSKI